MKRPTLPSHPIFVPPVSTAEDAAERSLWRALAAPPTAEDARCTCSAWLRRRMCRATAWVCMLVISRRSRCRGAPDGAAVGDRAASLSEPSEAPDEFEWDIMV